jgi:hypothetical protein
MPIRLSIHRPEDEHNETGTMYALDEWTPLDELAVLFGAESADELHRRLVVLPTVPGNTSDSFVPRCLFHQFHDGQPEGAATTAMLLVTDRRWRTATGRLFRRIVESGLVPVEDLDLLAQAFLAAGSVVYWEASADWFDGPEIAIDGPDGESEETDDSRAAAEDDGLVVVAREVRPPLRRWAAERRVRADPGIWGAMVARARELDSKNGAAVLRGVLDAIDTLPQPARTLVLALSADWPHRDVRKAARELTSRSAKPADPARRDLASVTVTSRKSAIEDPRRFYVLSSEI